MGFFKKSKPTPAPIPTTITPTRTSSSSSLHLFPSRSTSDRTTAHNARLRIPSDTTPVAERARQARADKGFAYGPTYQCGVPTMAENARPGTREEQTKEMLEARYLGKANYVGNKDGRYEGNGNGGRGLMYTATGPNGTQTKDEARKEELAKRYLGKEYGRK